MPMTVPVGSLSGQRDGSRRSQVLDNNLNDQKDHGCGDYEEGNMSKRNSPPPLPTVGCLYIGLSPNNRHWVSDWLRCSHPGKRERFPSMATCESYARKFCPAIADQLRHGLAL